MAVGVATMILPFGNPDPLGIQQAQRRVRGQMHKVRSRDDDALIVMQQALTFKLPFQEPAEIQENARRPGMLARTTNTTQPLILNLKYFPPRRIPALGNAGLIECLTPICRLINTPHETCVAVKGVTDVLTLVAGYTKRQIPIHNIQ